MLRRYYQGIAQPNPPEPYHRVSLKDRHKKDSRKLEIPVEWITEQWFAEGALDGINAEARDILLISIETGPLIPLSMIDDAEFIATMKAAQALGLLFEDAERGTHWWISLKELPDWLAENRVFLRPL